MSQPDTVPESAAGKALNYRDEALAALDAGDLPAALKLVTRGLAVVDSASARGGLSEVALLIARGDRGVRGSPRERGSHARHRHRDHRGRGQHPAGRPHGRSGEAGTDERATAGTATSRLALWCQAHERLAGLEQVAGDFMTARARLATVLDRASATFGEASLPVVSAASSLGMVCQAAADFDAAAAAYWRAGAALAGLAGPDPLIEAGLLHNLGGLALARGTAGTGIPLAERGAALRRELLGAGHPDVARDLNALGALYQLAERTDDAARAYGQALVTFETCYGPDHFEVGVTCANLAALRAGQGRNAEAEWLGRRSLRILEYVLGADDAEAGLTSV